MLLTTSIKSTADMVTVALQAEREAGRQYAGLASRMREAGNESVALLFERLAGDEQQHETRLLEWMARESITENLSIEPLHWSDERNPGLYDDEARSVLHSTPYRALAFAVNNEVAAFRFFSQIAAESTTEDLRRIAEKLAREALEHAALLRDERRRAYHQERKARRLESALDPAMVRHRGDLLILAKAFDQQLVDGLKRVAMPSPRIVALLTQTQDQLNEIEREVDRLPTDTIQTSATELSAQTARYTRFYTPLDTELSRFSELERLEILCDRSFVFYDAVVDSTSDESVLQAAQQFAALALDRISVLRSG